MVQKRMSLGSSYPTSSFWMRDKYRNDLSNLLAMANREAATNLCLTEERILKWVNMAELIQKHTTPRLYPIGLLDDLPTSWHREVANELGEQLESQPKPLRKLGRLAGKISLSREQALAPLSDDELADWEGR